MEDRLRKFAFLVDAGSFTKAAAALELSQPALSAAIAKLEAELHAKLLVRSVRPLKLTPAGKLAYGAAKALIACTTNLSVRLIALKQEKLSLSVGMIDSVADILFAADGNLSRNEEQAQISTVVSDSRSLLRSIEHDELDAAFVAEQPRKFSDLFKLRHVATEPLVPVRHVALDAATPFNRFIAYTQASTTFQLIADALRRHHIETEPIGYSSSPEIILKLLLTQKGSAVLPFILVRELLQSGTLVVAGRPRIIGRRIAMVRRHDKDVLAPLATIRRRLTLALDELMSEAREQLRHSL